MTASSPAPGGQNSSSPIVPVPGMVAVRMTLQEFSTPPVRDALVMGRRSPIGCIAMRKALALLQTTPFMHIELGDEVVSDIVVREAVVRIVGREKLIALVLQQIRPLMTAMDILHLDIDARLHLEAKV